MKEFLSEKKVEFLYFDISTDFGALKRFLKIRDTNSVFDQVREAGRVGIPAIINEDEIILGLDEDKLERIMTSL